MKNHKQPQRIAVVQVILKSPYMVDGGHYSIEKEKKTIIIALLIEPWLCMA